MPAIHDVGRGSWAFVFAREVNKRASVDLILKTGFSIIVFKMYVCSCFAVTDSEIEGLIAGGVTSIDQVTAACRAGGDCGACRGQISDMIADAADGSGLVPAQALTRKSCAA